MQIFKLIGSDLHQQSIVEDDIDLSIIAEIVLKDIIKGKIIAILIIKGVIDAMHACLKRNLVN